MVAKALLFRLCVVLLALSSNDAYSQQVYVAFLHPLNFFESWQECNINGGYLASIESPAEQTQVEKAMAKARNQTAVYYVGGTAIGRDGRWMWIGLNKEFAHRGYRNFYHDELNNISRGQNCLTVGNWDKPNRGKWDELECTTKVDGYICAFPVAADSAFVDARG
ncbi:perlucin-like protein [Anopheles arabiensis]|uniref:perlucin-like protein n=1 Tax=Anopheles arabiensis TaxID=7173 RepID=UPI001AAC75D8|nr:perlucin-like protein [Anopheles arabiensis]